jgi:hypothetical protein
MVSVVAYHLPIVMMLLQMLWRSTACFFVRCYMPYTVNEYTWGLA